MLEKCNPNRKMKGISEIVKKNDGLLLLDGGMITGMEELGANLYGAYKLWYPQYMDNEPDLITETHENYYKSGADIVMTATYNGRVKYSRYLNKGIELAVKARDNAAKHPTCHGRDLLVAAAQGPYGSSAINSLEYDGSYGKEISEEFLE